MSLLNRVHPSWRPYVDPIVYDKDLSYLKTNIMPTTKIYPAEDDIFNVFQMPVEDIKVVILGQDPYPREGQAMGYSFAVSEGTSIPASLRIIRKEIMESGATRNKNLLALDYTCSSWKTLQHWRDQGVFLLNTALTVEAGKAGSHIKYWNYFMSQLISRFSKDHETIWLLWGKKAQAFIPSIDRGNIVETPHPAAEVYSGGKAGFLGSNCFIKVNELLEGQQHEPVRW